MYLRFYYDFISTRHNLLQTNQPEHELDNRRTCDTVISVYVTNEKDMDTPAAYLINICHCIVELYCGEGNPTGPGYWFL